MHVPIHVTPTNDYMYNKIKQKLQIPLQDSEQVHNINTTALLFSYPVHNHSKYYCVATKLGKTSYDSTKC